MSENFYKRMIKASANGQQAFWESIRKEFPEINTGDFSPDAQYAFNIACNIATIRWIGANYDEES